MPRKPSVVRSVVPKREAHGAYKQELREDFWFSCAYCTRTETETQAKSFEIDHFVPVSEAPELHSTYANLMWSCSWCNGKKGDLHPPPEAQRDGIAFFRPDHANELDHFDVELDGKILGLTPCGTFTVEMLELDRGALRKLRRLRQRLSDSAHEVRLGLRALRSLDYDSLCVRDRAQFLKTLRIAAHMEADLEATFDDLVARLSAVAELDPDPHGAGAGRQRRTQLDKLKAQYPGKWRGRAHKRARGGEKTG